MCGIAGLYYPAIAKPVDPARIVAMRDALAHRGPDGAGVWTAPGVGLGHRRLSIIDLEGGVQPMATPDQGVVVTYNGEIYNFREVRAELEAKGARFQTESDTEVLLHGWRAWGPGMLEKLNGMFAFALYDAEKQSLFLARDRFGVKPLVYTKLADGGVAFASEIKGLLAHPLFRRRPDFRAVEDYLGLGYVPDDASLLVGVKKLPAGHFLLLQRGKRMPQPVRWWDLDFSNRATGKTRDLEAELVERMRAAVRARMIADVPLGAFLSGGVDSSAVVALMAEASKAAVKTCTIGFDEAGHDESDYARRISERFATAHRSKIVGSDDFALIDTLVAAFDEPFADASALPTYRVCELARETVTVALSGDGADEAFAGYRRYKFFAAEERARGLFPEKFRANLFGTLGRFYPKADWAPRAFRAKTTLLALAENGEFAYSRAVGGASRPALYQRGEAHPRRAFRRAALCRRDAAGAGARRTRPRAICRYPALAAGGHSDEGRPHQHGGEPRGTRAFARLSARRIRGDPAAVAPDQGGAGQMADEEGARAVAAQGHSLSAQNGVRYADQRVVPQGAGRRGSSAGAVARADGDRLVRTRGDREAGGRPQGRSRRARADLVAAADAGTEPRAAVRLKSATVGNAEAGVSLAPAAPHMTSIAGKKSVGASG